MNKLTDEEATLNMLDAKTLRRWAQRIEENINLGEIEYVAGKMRHIANQLEQLTLAARNNNAQTNKS